MDHPLLSQYEAALHLGSIITFSEGILNPTSDLYGWMELHRKNQAQLTVGEKNKKFLHENLQVRTLHY
jgi:hypothetical protein